MFDPGSSDVSSNTCDTQHGSATNLKNWLARSSNNRLVIMAGTLTQSGNYSAINSVYLSAMTPTMRNAQVLVCAANLSHSAVMSTYGPKLIGQANPSSCPSGSSRADMATIPVAPLPTFQVMNTSEAPPDGVWFRNSPATADTDRVTGHGVYMGDVVKLHCYKFGDAVGPYANRLWYYVDNVTRPTVPGSGAANVGYLNAHYVNDGLAANQIDAGVPAC